MRHEMHTAARPGLRECPAFTLIELLVVISIIALLLGILAPALGGARRVAQSGACLANLRGLGIAGQVWATEHQGGLVGSPESSARELLNDPRAKTGAAPGEMNGNATQPFDWAGPLAFGGYMGDNPTIPLRRDERFALVMGTAPDEPDAPGGPFRALHCPTNSLIAVPYDGARRPTGIENTAFQPRIAPSYTAALTFLWMHGSAGRPSWSTTDFWGNARGARGAVAGTYRFPFEDINFGSSAYKPRIDLVGALPSSKVMLAEGSRFQISTDQSLDVDIRGSGPYGGAFADVGAWRTEVAGADARTRAWPVGTNAIGQSMAGLSFKHGGRSLEQRGGSDGSHRGNVLFFDGHAETKTMLEMRRPDFWIPSKGGVPVNDIYRPLQAEYQERPGVPRPGNNPANQFLSPLKQVW